MIKNYLDIADFATLRRFKCEKATEKSDPILSAYKSC